MVTFRNTTIIEEITLEEMIEDLNQMEIDKNLFLIILIMKPFKERFQEETTTMHQN